MTTSLRCSAVSRFHLSRLHLQADATDEQRALMHESVWRVAWLGTSLFDHFPQLRFFDRRADAHAFMERLADVVWCVDDEVPVLAPEVWPPAVGDYPPDGDLWPWELLDFADLNHEAVAR